MSLSSSVSLVYFGFKARQTAITSFKCVSNVIIMSDHKTCMYILSVHNVQTAPMFSGPVTLNRIEMNDDKPCLNSLILKFVSALPTY